jgi:hypothetical protein
VTNSFGLNIYDILNAEKLLISKTAVEELNQLLDPKRECAKEAEVLKEKPKARKTAKPKVEKEAASEAAEEAPKAKTPRKTKPKPVVNEEAAENE